MEIDTILFYLFRLMLIVKFKSKATLLLLEIEMVLLLLLEAQSIIQPFTVYKSGLIKNLYLEIYLALLKRLITANSCSELIFALLESIVYNLSSLFIYDFLGLFQHPPNCKCPCAMDSVESNALS